MIIYMYYCHFVYFQVHKYSVLIFECYVILIVKCLNAVMEADVEKDMIERKEITLQPTEQSMEDELVSI